jgi:hypothetical protein
MEFLTEYFLITDKFDFPWSDLTFSAEVGNK